MAVVSAYEAVTALGEVRNNQNRLFQKVSFNDKYYLFYVDTSGATDYIYYKHSDTIAGLVGASATQLTTSSISPLNVGKVDVAVDGSDIGVAFVQNSGSNERLAFIRGTITAGGSITVDSEHNITTYISAGAVDPQIIRNSGDRWVIDYNGGSNDFKCAISELADPSSSSDWTIVSVYNGTSYKFGTIEDPDDSDKLMYFLSFGLSPTRNIKFQRIDVPTYALDGAVQDSGYSITIYGSNYSRPVVTSDGDIYVAYRDTSNDLYYAKYDGSWSNGLIDATGVANSETGVALTQNGAGLYIFANILDGATYDIRHYTSSDGSSWTNKTSSLTADFRNIASPNYSPVCSADNSEGLVAWNNAGDIWVGSVRTNLEGPLYAQNVMVFDSFVPTWRYNAFRHLCHYWNQEAGKQPK